MRSWNLLAEDGRLLLSREYEWPEQVASGIQSHLASFDRLCINRLLDIITANLPENIKYFRIRRFFETRWSVIVNTSLEYTKNPALLSNSWYVAVADKISNDAFNTFKILMPTLNKVVGSYDDSLLNDKIEALDLSQYLVCSDFQTLIPIETIYGYSKADTNYFYPVVHVGNETEEADSKIKFNLTAEDRESLRQVTPESIVLYDLLKEKHRIRHHQKPSIAYALSLLAEALLKSSKVENGSELEADFLECVQPINEFYHIWTRLASEPKNRVNGAKLNFGARSLGDFLLCLFAHTPGIALSADELRLVDSHIIPCTHLIGTYIQNVLNDNVWLQNVPLPGKEAEFEHEDVPDESEIEAVYAACIKSLSNRRLMLGKSDSKLITLQPFFSVITRYQMDEDKLSQVVIDLQSEIVSLNSLRYPLYMLPSSHWDQLFLLSRAKIDKYMAGLSPVFSVNEKVNFIIDILKSVDENLWEDFFDVVAAQQCHFVFTSECIGLVLQELNQNLWDKFAAAISDYAPYILRTPRDIADLFSSISFDYHQSAYVWFKKTIDSVLAEPRDFANFFNEMSREIWSSVFSLFSRTITYLIQNGKFLDIALDILHLERKISLIELLMRGGVPREDLIKNLHIILPRIDVSRWVDVFVILRLPVLNFPGDLNQLSLILSNTDPLNWSNLSFHFGYGIRLLIEKPAALSEILDKIPQAQLRHFIGVFFRVGFLVSSDFLIACLTMMSQEKRYTLIEILFDRISDIPVCTRVVGTLLNLLPLDDWGRLSAFISQRSARLSFSGLLDLSELLLLTPVEKWAPLKTHFNSFFEKAIRDEKSLILTARELPFSKFAAFFSLVSDSVKKYIRSINYLKEIAYLVKDRKVAESMSLTIATVAVNSTGNGRYFNFDFQEVSYLISRFSILQQHNSFLILEVIGLTEIHSYLKAVLQFNQGDDLSDMRSWRAIAESVPELLNLFFKSSLCFALVFSAVAKENWPEMASLISASLKKNLTSGPYLSSILLLLPEKDRFNFCAAVFPYFNPQSISLSVFSPVFNALPKKDWNDFYLLIPSGSFLSDLNELDDFFALMDNNDFDNIAAWYSLFEYKIELLIENPSDLVRFFSHFSPDFWSTFANCCSSLLINRFGKTDFLKETFLAIPVSHRMEFFRAIVPFLEEVKMNAMIFGDLLKLMRFDEWKNVIAILGKQNIARVITDESTLALVLHTLADHQSDFLVYIKDSIPNIRCDNPKGLMRLLVSFESLQSKILEFFKPHFIDIIRHMIEQFLAFENSGSFPPSSNDQVCFDFFVQRTLGYLLSSDYLKNVLDVKNPQDDSIINELLAELDEFKSDDIVKLSKHRLKVLKDFINEVYRDNLRERSFSEEVRFVVRLRLCRRLISHYGSRFFERISQYASCFRSVSVVPVRPPLAPPGVRPNQVVLFPQRAVQTPLPPAPVHGLFSGTTDAPRG